MSTARDEAKAIAEQRLMLDGQIAAIHAAVNARADALGSAEVNEKWCAFLTTARPTLCDELLAIKSPIRDKRILGRSINLTLSIKCIDFGLGALKDSGYALTNLRVGELMREAGYEVTGANPEKNYVGVMPWFGSLHDVEKRIADRAQRRANADAALASALMMDEERAAAEAEAKARRDALNALPVRKTRSDGSQYERYPDGRVVEISS